MVQLTVYDISITTGDLKKTLMLNIMVDVTETILSHQILGAPL